MNYLQISFCGKPQNYKKIDKYVSRSAQPNAEDFEWLKEQGVTDVINFRTLYETKAIDIEKNAANLVGIKYHQIPSITKEPSKDNIQKFLSLIEDIRKNNGKVHIHCKAGADRTGMYSFIYESLNNISTQKERIAEWMKMGHHIKLYPDLIPWTVDYVNKILQLK